VRYTAVLVALLLCLPGCGGSDSDSDSPATSTTTAAASDATTTTQPPSQPSTTAAGSSDGSSIDCPALEAWARDSIAAINPAFAGGGTSTEGAEFTAEFFQEFADRAPSEIRADFQIFADAYQGFFAAIEELGFDFSDPTAIANMDVEDMAALDEAVGMMYTPTVNEELDKIEAFFERECP